MTEEWFNRVLKKIDRDRRRVRRITREIYKDPEEVDVLEYIGIKKVEGFDG